MRHHLHNKSFEFVKEPIEFNKFTDKELLQYCIGGLLYMPATKDFKEAILKNKIPSLTSMVMCFEDAIDEMEIPEAEINAVEFLCFINKEIREGNINAERLPLIFFRIRSVEQFDSILGKLDSESLGILTGFVFPKFNQKNAIDYFSRLRNLNEAYGVKLYGMPILEGREIAYKETRFDELIAVKAILNCYKDIVLNVRVGGTDFSACFGVRRGIDYTIYDIMPVRDCLLDILNVFGRELDYVISGPVWEYFLVSHEMKFSRIDESKFQHSLLTREPIVNSAVDGLLRELIQDKANGFIGKTTIHPSHLPFVNGMQAVTKDEYDDAIQILGKSGGVMKSTGIGKMNEVRPHTNWAKIIQAKARAYGVIENEGSYLRLFMSVN